MEYETGPSSIDAALAELATIEAQLRAMGAVDVETTQLAAWRQELFAGKMTAEKAVAAARKMMDARQEYH